MGVAGVQLLSRSLEVGSMETQSGYEVYKRMSNLKQGKHTVLFRNMSEGAFSKKEGSFEIKEVLPPGF